MSLLRILAYFLSEAALSLRRSWKVSCIAVLTIAMSVFIAGVFLLLTSNLDRVVGDWREQAKLIIYFDKTARAEDIDSVESLAVRAPWVESVEVVSGSRATARFQTTFPSVKGLLESWDRDPLPPSLEIGFREASGGDLRFEEWLEEVRLAPSVAMVDDDRDWLRHLNALISILRGLALVVGAALLGAAIVTIASVIRLTAYLFREEISVMRLVGATELYIRGPFFFEGMIQGLIGSCLALSTLFAAFVLLNPASKTTLLGTVLVGTFLPWQSILQLMALGTLAGCLGAVVSLRRETLE